MAERSSRLAQSLLPGDPSDFRAEVSAIIGTLASPITDNTDTKTKIGLYCVALSDLPPWAVREAIGAALRGKVGNYCGRYLPAPGELHAAAESYLEPLRAERADIERVLRAQPIEVKSEEECAAMRERIEILRAGCVASLRAARPKNELAIEARQRADAERRSKLFGPETTDEELTRALR